MLIEEAYEIVENVDLEIELVAKGINPGHIKYIKENRPEFDADYSDYYEQDSDNDRERVLVEPKKIKGITRANFDLSYYANANGEGSSNLNVFRMAEAVEHIKNDELKEIYKWYKDLYDPVKLIYYSDDDVYVVGSDGNHRSLYAIIANAPMIRADVRYYKKDINKYQAFLRMLSILRQYDLRLEWNQAYTDKEFIFKFRDLEYSVRGYIDPKNFEGYDHDKMNQLENQLESDWKYLGNNKLIFYLSRYSFLKRLFLKIFINEEQALRIEKHIDNRMQQKM